MPLVISGHEYMHGRFSGCGEYVYVVEVRGRQRAPIGVSFYAAVHVDTANVL